MAPALDSAELQDEFALFGIEIDSSDVMDKLKEIAVTHCYDVTRIVNCWMAFSKSNEDLPLTLETLSRFERDHSKVVSRTPQTPSSSGNRANRSFATPIISQLEADEFLEAYGTPSSKGSKKRTQATPEVAGKRVLSGRGGGAALTASAGSPVIGSGGSSASPQSAAVSRKYQQRAGAGEVLLKYGSGSRGSQKRKSKGLTKADVNPCDSVPALVVPFKYMFQRILDQCAVINKKIDTLSDHLKTQLSVQAEDISSAPDVTQDDVTVVGMVVCDSNGKLNDESVLLQGCKKYSPAAQAYPISLQAAREFSLFPGQVVALKGRNPDGKKFLASEVHVCRPLAQPKVDLDLLSEELSMVIACGSFTTSDSLAYEPLQDLCKYIVQHKPDVCLLVGPFLDPSNTENEKLSITYEENFNSKMNWLLEQTEGLPTLFVVVASHKDLHHDFVYPTAPYRLDGSRRQHERLLFVSDPSTLVIGGVVFGMTSVDVLFHLSSQEISRNSSIGDRLSRLLNHVLSQQTYYPLYPPHDDTNLDLEYQHVYCNLPITPHLLIVPSDLKYFIKEVNGCLCINPGRLAKGQTGGSFAHVVVSPPTDQEFSGAITTLAAVEIIRI